jgi:UDP-glucose 4-epimerase
MTHGRQVRDFLHVEDVARALVALLLSDVGGAVNVASGEAITLGEVAETLARASGRGVLERGAIAAPEGEPVRIVADVARLRTEVGFRPRFALEQGLVDVMSSLRG